MKTLLMDEVRDAALDLRVGGQRWCDGLTLVLTLTQLRGGGLPLLATSCPWLLKNSQICKRPVNLLWHPPSQPLVSLSAQVCSAAGPYTALHSVTLQWPVSCRPPGRMASLLNHSPVIEPELSFQRAQPTLRTPPNTCSGMSAKLPHSLV